MKKFTVAELWYILNLAGVLSCENRLFDEDGLLSGDEWKSPTKFIPKQGSKVEVIDCKGKLRIGRLCADDNWEIPGHSHDLFNNMIFAWRYKE